jgi:hypothetical protein
LNNGGPVGASSGLAAGLLIGPVLGVELHATKQRHPIAMQRRHTILAVGWIMGKHLDEVMMRRIDFTTEAQRRQQAEGRDADERG